jgi:hypothetical protein
MPDFPDCMPLLWYIDSPEDVDHGLADKLLPLFSPELIADLEAWVDVWTDNDEFEVRGAAFVEWVEHGRLLFERVRTLVEPHGYLLVARLE